MNAAGSALCLKRGPSELGKCFGLQLQEKSLFGWSCGIAAEGWSRRRRFLGTKTSEKGGWEQKVSTNSPDYISNFCRKRSSSWRVKLEEMCPYPMRNPLPTPSVLLSWALLRDLGAGPRITGIQPGSLVKSPLTVFSSDEMWHKSTVNCFKIMQQPAQQSCWKSRACPPTQTSKKRGRRIQRASKTSRAIIWGKHQFIKLIPPIHLQ